MKYRKLKQLREEYEITQARLGEFMRVSEEDIEEWEAGVCDPSPQQIHRLATLFNIEDAQLEEIEERIETPSDSNTKEKNKKVKTQKKKKIKRKTKRKKKVRKGRNKESKKRSSLPIILFIILLLLGIGCGAGYLYWKYGDDYFIGKKSDLALKTEDLVGSFYREAEVSSNPTLLTLKSDETFLFKFNSCETTSEVQGTWSLKENTITLHANGNESYTLLVKSSNELHYSSQAISCGPSNKDVFIRGNIVEAPPLEDKYTMTNGTWKDASTTLVISNVTSDKAVFTLTSIDLSNPTNSATLSNIEGTIDGSTVHFTFTDDGFGSTGKGSITIQEDKAVFSITKTFEKEEALWSIPTSGTLKKG